MTFDLEAARAGIAHYRIENHSNVDTESAIKELVDQANLAEDALAEIERLRPFEIAARDLDSDLTKIAGERDDQAARIKELEDALAEERAKYNLSWKDCAYRAPDTYCEKTHNYCTSEDCPLLDEQKTEARRQLRAEGKIGNSEHFTEPTKMIGFDLERARVEVDTASARRFSESREQARIFCAEEILPDALDEIERLRPFEIAARDLDSDLTKIAGERDDQAARIKELEDAHKRSGAKYAKIINELRSSVYANIPGLDVGKIGPDAKPRSWQITEERKAALAAMSNLSETISCPDCGVWIGFADIGPHMAVLRAMLTEAE